MPMHNNWITLGLLTTGPWSDEEIDAAQCIWEELLLRRQKNEDDPTYAYFADGEGMATARSNSAIIARIANLAYDQAKTEGFDDSFDWEFVPRFIDAYVALGDQETNENPLTVFKNIGSDVYARYCKEVK